METSLEVLPDSSMQIRYAVGFKVDYFKHYKRIILSDPWKKGAELVRYYLIENDSVRVPADGIRIRIPLRSLVSGSCTQYTFLEQLGVLSSVKGICDAKTIYNASLRRAVQSGSVVDLGDPFQLNVERCLVLKPEALLMNSFNQQDEHLARIRESGIPVLYDNEWMESDLLGRAEWIRFVSCFFNQEALAERLFQSVSINYERLKKLAATSLMKKPEVLSGDDFRGTWYLPGGKSYTAQLFSDAGASYKYQSDTTTGSRPFTFEQVLKDFNRADVWVGVTNGASLDALRSFDERYTLFESFRRGNVFAYTNRTTPEGGNDFWESAVANPDKLLSDYIKAFHPELLPDAPWHYLRKLR
ncbi:MAG TPA: ABC transporter substrate-binding protein [Bacteroidales bacterium]|nr:ABC transporter substrate-binding protein [Bacteroidales bacterium]